MKKITKKLSTLESLIGMQRRCLHSTTLCNDKKYHHGLANGLILAHGIISDAEQIRYITRYGGGHTKIRHKCKHRRRIYV